MKTTENRTRGSATARVLASAAKPGPEPDKVPHRVPRPAAQAEGQP